MQHIASHLVLVSAPTLETGISQVQHFFDTTMLVRYDKIEILRKDCYSGEDDAFNDALAQGLASNTATLSKFIGEFERTGFREVGDLVRVQCGYPSKLLHIITHFLDGFISIDSKFYNLVDDSHWLPEATRNGIAAAPEHYWLIKLDGYSATPDKVSLVQA